MYDGQSSDCFLVAIHILSSKRRNDTELNWDIEENVSSRYFLPVIFFLPAVTEKFGQC